MNQKTASNQIDLKIRQLRKEKGLTMEKLGQLAGCTKAYISQLENRKTAPSLSMLGRLAKVLGVSVSDLLGSQKGNGLRHRKLKKADRMAVQYPDGKIVDYILTRGVAQKKMQPLLCEIKRGGASDESSYLQHPPGSEEFVLVLKGAIDFYIEKKGFKLREGDTIYFEGNLKHHWVNNGKKTAEVLFIWTPPVW